MFNLFLLCDKNYPCLSDSRIAIGVGPAGSGLLYADTVARSQKSPPYNLQREQIHIKSVFRN